MVQERRTRLEAHAHRRPVHLHQKVVREIAQGVHGHQPGREPGGLRPACGLAQDRIGLGCPHYDRGRVLPVRATAPVELLQRSAVGQQRQLARSGLQPAKRTRLAAQLGRARSRDRGCAEPAQRQRHGGQPAPTPGRRCVVPVAAEQLVAAVSGQGDRHMPTRHAGNQECRHLRRIGKGFVEELGQPGDDVSGLLRGDVQLGVVRTEVAGHGLGVFRFVVFGLIESNREGAHRPAGLGLHQGDDGGRIDAAGEERAKRRIRHHLPADRLQQQMVQLPHRVFGAACERFRPAGRHHAPQRPVAPRFRQFSGALPRGIRGQPHVGARRQRSYAFVYRPRRRNAAVAQEQGERVPVDVGRERRVRHERLELRAEQEHAVLPAVVERLLAQAVAGETERFLLPIPKREGEHSGSRPQRLLQPPVFDGGQQRFRIGVPSPCQARTLGVQSPSELRMVVDLAVEDDDASPRGGQHRLMASRRQVDDGQALVSQRDAGLAVEPDAGIVGAAMRDGVRHPAGNRRRFFRNEALPAKKSRYATHAVFSVAQGSKLIGASLARSHRHHQHVRAVILLVAHGAGVVAQQAQGHLALRRIARQVC